MRFDWDVVYQESDADIILPHLDTASLQNIESTAQVFNSK